MSDIYTNQSDEEQLHGFNPGRFNVMTATKKGFVKPNKFLARFPLPRGFSASQGFAGVNRDLEFWCETAALPGAALATRDVARYGYGVREKRPVGNIFQDINFTFYADGGTQLDTPNMGTNWNYFTSWVRMISNFDMSQGAMMADSTAVRVATHAMAPYELSYKYEYAVDIDVVVFRPDGSESHHVILRDAFPVYVQEIKTSWSEAGSIMQIPVLFTYTDWYPVVTTLANG
jgi:hypothetical protein